MKQKITDIGDKISKENIDDWENENDVKLPDEYKYFLLKYNGGTTKLNCFKHKDNQYMIDAFFELDEIEDEKAVDEGSYIPEKMFPIAYDPGGNLYLISLEENNYGFIYFWNHEDSEITAISNNFNSFFNSLVIYKDELDFENYCSNNKVNKAINLVEKGLDINTKNKYGETLIQIASKYCNTSKDIINLIKLLISKGSSTDFLLGIASSYEVIDYLISIGEDINKTYGNTNEYETILIRFSKYSRYDMLKFLLERGANPHIKDSHAKKALDYVKNNMGLYKLDYEYHKKSYDLLIEAEEKFDNV